MKPYTKEFKCPKCGNDTNITSYIATRDVIRRKCLVCDYEEDQLPLDRTVENKAPNVK